MDCFMWEPLVLSRKLMFSTTLKLSILNVARSNFLIKIKIIPDWMFFAARVNVARTSVVYHIWALKG